MSADQSINTNLVNLLVELLKKQQFQSNAAPSYRKLSYSNPAPVPALSDPAPVAPVSYSAPAPVQTYAAAPVMTIAAPAPGNSPLRICDEYSC